MNVSNIFGSVSPLTDAVSFTNIFESQKTDHHLLYEGLELVPSTENPGSSLGPTGLYILI